MQINYLKYFKYKLLLQSRRKFSSIEKFLKKFFPRISYNKILFIWILKYIIEVMSASLTTYFVCKNNVELTKELIFPIIIFYLIIHSTKVFAQNYNKIINPEDSDFLKTFPINNLKYTVLIGVDSFLFCIFGSFLKRILQLYIPCILIFEKLYILNGLLVIILLLYVSFSLANIFIYIKFFISNGEISFLKGVLYFLTCIGIYKFMKTIMYYSIMIFNTFPYGSLKTKDVDHINDWINITCKSIQENFMFCINKYFLNTYSPISNLKGITFGDNIVFNSTILVIYMCVLTIIFVALVSYVKKQNDIKTIKASDIVLVFVKFIILIINKFSIFFEKFDTSIYNIIAKDLKIFNNYRELINSKFFNIFGGLTIWIIFAFISSLKDVSNFIGISSYMKIFNIIILIFSPLFISLDFHEKLKNSFKFIFFIDGEGRNINIFKITGYPMEKLFKSKKIIFFIFSIPLYLTIFFSYIIICKLNLEESIILLLNLICIYYSSCNFYLVGSLFNSDFSWKHIDDQGNNVGQSYISNTLVRVFAFFYSMILVIFSILYITDALQIMFFIYIVMILILYYINRFILKKALLQINYIIYSEEI